MRKVTTAIALALLGSGLGACGGGSDADAPASDEQIVTDVLTAYGAALEGGRTDEICMDLFAPVLVEELESMGGCEAALGEVPEPDAFDLAVDAVTIDGTMATAEVTVVGGAGAGSADGPAEVQGSVTLLKEGEAWRISQIG